MKGGTMQALSAAPGRVVAEAEVRERTDEDEAVFDALYRARGAWIYGYLRYRLGDDALAEDLTAEAFVRL
jgi:DNA-directed RNA polymerase specialized sigma24 family protein